VTSLRPTARVARGATYLFVQGFSNAILGLIYFIFLTHTFQDPSEQWQMGVYTLLSFILGLVQMFGTLALQSASIKYIAQYLAEGDSEKAKSVVVRVLQMSLLASIIVFLSLFIPAEWVSSLMFGTAAHALLIRLIALCSIFAILSLETASFLQGMQRMFEVALIGLAYTIISTSVGIYLLYSGWGLYAVVLGWIAGWLIASISSLILTVRYLGVLGKPCSVRPLLNFSFPLYVSNGISFWVGWVDQLLLVSYMSLILGTTEAQRILGIYYVAIRASAVPALFSNSIVSALFPQLSELYTQQGSSSLKDAFRVSARYSVLVGFPLIVGLATLAYPIIILFGGWQYVEATEPMIIISIAALAGTLGVAAGPILLTLERTKISSALSVVSVVLSFFLSYFALAGLGSGMVGVAWARTLASIISLVLTLYVVTRYVPISFDKEAIWKASIASALLAASIVGLDLVRMLLSPSSHQFLVFPLRLLPIYVIVGALAYFFSLVGLRAIKKHDVELIHDYLPRKLKWVADWLGRIAMVE
jgi:O-antigen/teichoic acid export membrane protein